MIDRLSSSQISSQLRTAEIGGTSTQTQEKELDIPVQIKDGNQENFNFPKEKVKEFVDSLNRFIETSPTALKFEFHEKLNEYYVKIIDEKTKETVREIPPKKMLDFYAAMTEFIGLMVDKKI